jgi:hypothetical protein
MGKSRKIKKYRKQIKQKLDSMGLKNETLMLSGDKEKTMVQFQTDKEGNMVLSEAGEPVRKNVYVKLKQLSNPYKSTLKKLLRLEEKEIKQFLKQE